MKRKRDNNNTEEDDRPQIGGPSRINFAISPESTSSNTANILNLPLSNNNNNDNNIDHIANPNIIRSINAISNKEQDRFLPIANVGRIMKKVIPGNGKISKDAKETVQECVSEFISFVTGEASDKCQREKRKTINGEDILWAIMTLGFEDYASPLKVYLNRYRDIDGEKMNTPKQQQQQQRCDQRAMMNEQQSQGHNLGYTTNANNVYSTTNLMSQPPFMANDHPFPLPFSQNSMQNGTLPQQDHVDEQW